MSKYESVRYVGNVRANIDYHHGQLKPVVGTNSYQVLRANREHPEWAEGTGWTYNHAPMLAYWNNTFYLEYLSNPVGEHIPPGQTLLTTSKNGRDWAKPVVVFPPYELPHGTVKKGYTEPLPDGTHAVMHQRMGFYTASNGRFMVIAYYGISVNLDNPNDGRGIGRVIREVYADGNFGPIYFIRYNQSAGWGEENTRYPFYTKSNDKGFVEACDELLSNTLMVQQWIEECDRDDELIKFREDLRSFCYYHAADGRVVGLWKWSKVAVSEDNGNTWSPVHDEPSLVMAGAKIWGQRTSDGMYALVYNPVPDNNHRWPLAIVTGKDGFTFDNLRLVVGEVPLRRYHGAYKDAGLNYIRGIDEGNGIPPDGGMWVTYSVGKEDIWVTRIPVPVKLQEENHIDEDFSHADQNGIIKDWNIYSPIWAPVTIEPFPSKENKSMKLADKDPYDYAKAERLFPASSNIRVSLKVMAGQKDHGELHIELQDGKGAIPLRILFDTDGYVKFKTGDGLLPVFRV